jgi:hypothetical protein
MPVRSTGQRVGALLQFSTADLLAAHLRAVSIGAPVEDDSGDEREQRREELERDRAQTLLEEARQLYETGLPADETETMPYLQTLRRVIAEIFALFSSREELDDDLEDSLRFYAARLNAVVQRLEAPATQPPDAMTSEAEPVVTQGGGASSGGAFLVSQLADDLENYDDELTGPPPTAPGQATQLEAEPIDDERGRRAAQLRALRDEAVTLLRSLPVDGRVSAELRERARQLRLRASAFAQASDTARRILTAMAEVLAMPEAAAGSDAVAPAQPPQAPQGPAIVGRATDVLPSGVRQQSFLLFQTPRTYTWLEEMRMRADPQLSAILDAFVAANPASAGDDPSGKGWVVAVVAARGPMARRQYRVRWTVDPSVPISEAEEYMLRRQLVPGAQAMADAFERQDDDDDDSSDEEPDGAGGGDGPGDSQPSQPGPMVGGANRPSALQWDPAGGRPKLSLRRAIVSHAQGQSWTNEALFEYKVTCLLALLSRTPPATGQPGAPTPGELDQLGADLFDIDGTALIASFRRERAQEQRDRAAAGEEQDDDDEDPALSTWRAARERELRDDALARWTQTLQQDAPEIATINTQLAALRNAMANADTLDDDAVAAMAKPRLRLPKIRDYLMPNRSAQARGWLKLQRDAATAATAAERRTGVYGSAYGPSWPALPSATSTPGDHVVPTRWYEGGTKLIIECGDPAQTPAVVLSTLAENSAKSDDALSIFAAPGEAARAGQGVYVPRNVSEAKKAMLAKTTAWIWGLYMLISDKKRTIAIGAYARSTGCAWYARAWQNGPFKQLVRTPASSYERRIQLLTLAMPRWQMGNPLVFNPGLLNAELEELLLRRFKGTDALPKLVDEALQAGVAGAPR